MTGEDGRFSPDGTAAGQRWPPTLVVTCCADAPCGTLTNELGVMHNAGPGRWSPRGRARDALARRPDKVEGRV
jgi:hypothetical protein